MVKLELSIDKDGVATVVSIDWPVPIIGGNASQRRETCRQCEHVQSISELTVSCKLCGCGGLRLDGPSLLCRAGKWNNESE